jgi:hypothetical protein
MNSYEVYGEDEVFRALIQNQLTEFEDDRIRAVGQHGFQDRTGLEVIRLPNCRDIDMNGISNCHDLKILDIGAPCYIRSTAIVSGYKLHSILLRSTEEASYVNSWGIGANALISGHGAIYVPRSLMAEYRQKWSEGWRFQGSNRNAVPFLIGHLQALEDYPVTDFSTIPLTWTQIKAGVEDGSFFTSGYMDGDMKKLEYGQYTAYLKLARMDAENHYVEFLTINIAETVQMAAQSSVVLPYSESLHKARLDAIYSSELPVDLKAVITPVTKRYGSAVQAGYEDVTLPLWTPSLKELGRTGSVVAAETGTAYEVFQNVSNLQFYSADPTLESYTPMNIWIPTSYLSGNVSSYYYSTVGTTSILKNPYGLLFGFRIAKTA